MKKTHASVVCLFALIVALCSGCVASIGNREPGRSHGTTLGQELIDLQKAKEAGVISEAEYQQQRARLLGSETRR